MSERRDRQPDSYRILRDAVSEIENGSTVGIGGYFQYRHPMAVIREMVRQGKRDIHVVTPLGGFDSELIIATGVASKITFGFISMDIYGLAPSFRRHIEEGTVEAVEYGDLALIRAFEATERGLPWMPTRAWTGSDIGPYHPGEVLDTGAEEKLFKAPALQLDWVLVHVPYASAAGDLVMLGEAYDAVMIKSATHVLATTETIIPKSEIAARWGGRTAARYFCDYVIELPFGAHPTSCYPAYVQDVHHLLEYMDAVDTDLNSYVDRYIEPAEDQYLDGIGADRLLELQQRMSLARRSGTLQSA